MYWRYNKNSKQCYLHTCTSPFSLFSLLFSRSLTRNDALQIFCLTSSQMMKLLWWKTEGNSWLFGLQKEVSVWPIPIHCPIHQRMCYPPHCRYSCLVCSHRPVFDTVDMLVVHRKGKRHLEGEILLIHLLSFSINQHSGFKSSLVY